MSRPAPAPTAVAGGTPPRDGGSFARVVAAELGRVLRPRTLAEIAVGALAFALVSGISTFTSATDVAVRASRGAPRLADLIGPGGATEAFAIGASFGGFLVFVTFIALIAGEFSGGTFRAMLLRYPNRLGLIAGKFAALLAVTAVAVAAAEVLTVGVSLAMAPGQGIATDGWFSATGAQAALADYGTVLAGVTGWAVFGATLGVVLRTVPLALGVGFAWAGPFENIVAESWEPGFRFFPGQVMGALMRGGTEQLPFGRAVATALAYALVAVLITLVVTSRRDVTS